MTQVEEKPSLDEAMAHFGVRGMKWGVTRTQGTTSDIQKARVGIKKAKSDIKVQQQEMLKTGKNSAERVLAKQKVQTMQTNLLKNPDRILASRLTRGEKALAIAASLLVVTPVFAITLIGATSTASRRIEYKQENDMYDK